MKKSILIVGLCMLITNLLKAQNPGDLDNTFGTGGFTFANPYQNSPETYTDMVVLSDDKIVKIGYRGTIGSKDVLVAKFLKNGLPDSTFGNNAFTAIDLSLGGDEDANAIVALSNGKFLITGQIQSVGSRDGFIARLNADGSVDNSFGTSNGHTKFNTGDNTNARGKCIVLSGSEIFVGGSFISNGKWDIFIVNLTIGGGIDLSFASSGFATMDIKGDDDAINALDVKSNGSFVFGGTADSAGTELGYVASLSQFGTPTTFGTAGVFTINMGSPNTEVNDLYVDANDKIVLTGDHGTYPNVDGFVSRLTTSGSWDNTFGSSGTIPSNPGATTALFLRRILETPNGNILALGNFGGASQDLYAFMLTQTGSPNTNFGGNGDVNIPFTISTNTVNTSTGGFQSDGSIIMGGSLTSQALVGSNLFITRLHPILNNTSTIDRLNHTVIKLYPNPIKTSFEVDLNDFKRMDLINITGEIVESWKPQQDYLVPSNTRTGLYVLRIQLQNDQTIFTKVLINK